MESNIKEVMITYSKILREKLSYLTFNEEIEKAKYFIAEANGLTMKNFSLIRNHNNQEYVSGGEEFFGEYIIIEMSNENKVLGYLNIFFDSEKNFLEIFTISI